MRRDPGLAPMTSTQPEVQQTPDDEGPVINSFRAQHLALAEREIATEDGKAKVVFDEGESPLIWLARRRGRDGNALVEPHQLQAGERLRHDFTYANLMPSTTANWSNPSP